MNRKSILSRRELLALGSSATVAAVALKGSDRQARAEEHQGSAASYPPRKTKARPKNIIFLVSDGMSMGVPTLADPFSRLLIKQGTEWPELIKRPEAEHGYLETGSLNSLVTDSAAAASAWGSGHQVNNGVLNVLPNEERLTPITVFIKDKNIRTGLVTTDKLTGATPSGFAAVQKSRHDYLEIAPQFMDRVDVLLGGGRNYFQADARKDNRELVEEYRARGYQVCFNRHDMRLLPPSDRILGLFAEDVMPYTIDLLNDDSMWYSVPMLAEMAQVAIENLADKDKGFFLMIEGARIDHAAHANDAAAILHDQIAFESALGVALEFASGRDDTLLVVTSDHGNANLGLNGCGPSYSKTNESFARLAKVRASFGKIRERLLEAAVGQDLTEATKQVLGDTCRISISQEMARTVGQAIVKKKLPKELAVLQRSWVGVLSQVLGNHTGIGFTGTNHTADRVMLTAIGPGADRFAGIRPHRDVFHIIADLWGLPVV